MSRVVIPVYWQDARACKNACNISRRSIGIVWAGGFRNNVPIAKDQSVFSHGSFCRYWYWRGLRARLSLVLFWTYYWNGIWTLKIAESRDTMPSVRRDTRSLLLEECPLAVYTHCRTHCLLFTPAIQPVFRNMLEHFRKPVNFSSIPRIKARWRFRRRYQWYCVSCFIHSNLTCITGYFKQTVPRSLPYSFKQHFACEAATGQP